MTTTTSRRAVLAGTATALAAGAAVNLAAIVAAKADLSPRGEMSDPIFAAIERHRAAVLRWLEALEVYGVMRRGDHGYEDARLKESEAGDDQSEAAETLIETVPTTFAGILALTEYLAAYNAGGVKLSTRKGLHSSVHDWPAIEEDGIEITGFAFVNTIASALKAIASREALS